MTEPKVFSIGRHKTGTSSLKVALRMLGYSATGLAGARDRKFLEKMGDVAVNLAEQFDAVQASLMYQEMDQRYPGSKFILTLRNSDEWIKSMVGFFGTTQMGVAHGRVYGTRIVAGHEDQHIAHFERHNQEVIDYFADRPDDLLVMNITEGDGWEKLCAFLGKPVPDQPFPHRMPFVGQPRPSVVRRGLRRLKRVLT